MRKLAIDCRCIQGKYTGVGKYVLNILEYINCMSENITLIFDKTVDDKVIQYWEEKGYRCLIIPCKNYIIYEQILLPKMVSKNFDYIWFPSNTGSIFIKSKIISTIHDTIYSCSFKEIPLSGKLYKDLGRIYRRIIAPILARKSEVIYTVSEYSKQDIKKRWNINDDKIKVFYNVMDQSNIIKSNIDDNLKENYILSFGSDEPRKNTDNTIKIFKRLIDSDKVFKDYKLVLYGYKNYRGSSSEKLIESLNLKDRVIVYGYISDKKLSDLYKKAKLFLFLSKYEGFGIPILESMSYGTPVITLKNSCLPEIAGEAGIFIEDDLTTKCINKIKDLLIRKDIYELYVNRGYMNLCRFDSNEILNKIKLDLNRIMK